VLFAGIFSLAILTVIYYPDWNRAYGSWTEYVLKLLVWAVCVLGVLGVCWLAERQIPRKTMLMVFIALAVGIPVLSVTFMSKLMSEQDRVTQILRSRAEAPVEIVNLTDRIMLTNRTSKPLTNCEVRLMSGYSTVVSSLAVGEVRVMGYSQFAANASRLASETAFQRVATTVTVACRDMAGSEVRSVLE
jgi:hypothetical protein